MTRAPQVRTIDSGYRDALGCRVMLKPSSVAAGAPSASLDAALDADDTSTPAPPASLFNGWRNPPAPSAVGRRIANDQEWGEAIIGEEDAAWAAVVLACNDEDRAKHHSQFDRDDNSAATFTSQGALSLGGADSDPMTDQVAIQRLQKFYPELLAQVAGNTTAGAGN